MDKEFFSMAEKPLVGIGGGTAFACLVVMV
jgi:hypothetical protein